MLGSAELGKASDSFHPPQSLISRHRPFQTRSLTTVGEPYFPFVSWYSKLWSKSVWSSYRSLNAAHHWRYLCTGHIKMHGFACAKPITVEVVGDPVRHRSELWATRIRLC